MTLSVISKTINIVNGTSNDGSVINQMYIDCYGNDATIASYVNANCALFTGPNSFTGTQTFLAKSVHVLGINVSEALEPTTPSPGDFWYSAVNSAFEGAVQIGTLTAATNATPVAYTTASAHGLTTGQSVIIAGALGNTGANGAYVVTVTGATTFTGTGSIGNGAWTSGGTVSRIETFQTIIREPYPTGFHGSAAPLWASATTITVPFVRERDSTDTVNISITGSTTLDITTTGTSGILRTSSNLTGTITYTNTSTAVTGASTTFSTDYVVGDTIWDQTNSIAVGVVSVVGSNTSITLATAFSGVSKAGASHRRGSRAPGAFFYIYAITDGTNNNLVLSTRNTMSGQVLVDLPANYVKYRQIPYSCQINSSNNIIEQYITTGWPYRPRIELAEYTTNQVLSALSSTSFTPSLLVLFIPAVSRFVEFLFLGAAGNLTFSARPTGSSATNGVGISGAAGFLLAHPGSYTNSSQSVDLKVSANNSAVWAYSYIITEVT